MVTVIVAVPVFSSVTICAPLVVETTWPPKVTLFGATVAAGAVPVPLRLMDCGLVLASSVTVRVPPRLPAAEGVKVTVIVQLLLTATVLPQVFVCEKSPLVAILLTFKMAVPGLLSVTDFELLVVPTNCPANVRLDGDRVAAEAGPLPVRATV